MCYLNRTVTRASPNVGKSIGQEALRLLLEEGKSEYHNNNSDHNETDVPPRSSNEENNNQVEAGTYDDKPHHRGPRPRLFNKNNCQVDGCTADLSQLSWYNRRNHICETHAKIESVSVLGVLSRFCQRCGHSHPLSEFEGIKRSCRASLEKYNAARRERGRRRRQRRPSTTSNAAAGTSNSSDDGHASSSAAAAAVPPPPSAFASYQQQMSGMPALYPFTFAGASNATYLAPFHPPPLPNNFDDVLDILPSLSAMLNDKDIEEGMAAFMQQQQQQYQQQQMTPINQQTQPQLNNSANHQVAPPSTLMIKKEEQDDLLLWVNQPAVTAEINSLMVPTTTSTTTSTTTNTSSDNDESKEDSFIASLFSDNPLSTSGSLASLTAAANPSSSIAVRTEDHNDMQVWADCLLDNVCHPGF